MPTETSPERGNNDLEQLAARVAAARRDVHYAEVALEQAKRAFNEALGSTANVRGEA